MSTTKTGVFNVVLSHCCQSWILPTCGNRSSVRNAFLNAGNYCELIIEGCVFGTVFRRDQRYKNNLSDPRAWLFVIILCSSQKLKESSLFSMLFCKPDCFFLFPSEKTYSGCACLHRKSWRKLCSKCCYWEVCILQYLVWIILITTDADYSVRKDASITVTWNVSKRHWCHITFKYQI